MKWQKMLGKEQNVIFDLSKYYRIEDIPNSKLDIIKNEIDKVFSDIVPYKNLFIAGSYCFNLKTKIVNDVDICVLIDKNIYEINNYTGKGYSLINKMGKVSFDRMNGLFNKKVQIIPMNFEYFYEKVNYSNMKAPYFDLVSKQWYNKKPYDYFPYTWAYSKENKKREWVHRSNIPSKFT